MGKENILWDKTVVDTSCLILNNSLQLDDRAVIKEVKHLINEFADKWRKALKDKQDDESDDYNNFDILINGYKKN